MPLAVVVFTVLIVVAFQTYQLTREKSTLHTLISNQDGPMEEAERVRNQLSSIAGGTARLARQGNVNAQNLVRQLEAQGITLKDNPPQAEQAGD